MNDHASKDRNQEEIVELGIHQDPSEFEKRIADHIGRPMAKIRKAGSLPQDEVAAAATAYFENACELLSDSHLLVAHGRPQRAIGLAVLSLEELAKIPMIVNTWLRDVRGEERAWAEYWKVGGRHKPKQELLLAYGSRIRTEFDGDPMSDRKLYEFYPLKELVEHLDRFKQSSWYVDIREDGIHQPVVSPADLEALDFILALVQERADSFEAWHGSVRRSQDFLDQVVGNRAHHKWSSYTQAEVAADILYQAVIHSASEIPDYMAFNAFFQAYHRSRPSKRVVDALSQLITRIRSRLERVSELPLLTSRSLRLSKLLLGAASREDIIGRSRSRKLLAELA